MENAGIHQPPGYGLNSRTCIIDSLRKLLQQYLITKTELLLQLKNMGWQTVKDKLANLSIIKI